MFGQFVFGRLRAARTALKKGQLEDAFRLVNTPDILRNRQSFALRDELAARLVERARAHFRADRFMEALADLDRALACGCRLEEARQLREHVATVAGAIGRQDMQRAQNLEAARRRMESGSLEGGARMLAAFRDDPAARELEMNIERRRAEADALMKEAKRLHQERQTAQAFDRLAAAKRLDAHHQELASLQRVIIQEGLEQAMKALGQGEDRLCEDWLRRLENLNPDSTDRLQLVQGLRDLREAAGAFRQGKFDQARQHLTRVAQAVPGIKWVNPAIRELKTLGEAQEKLLAGPLGLIAEKARPPIARPAAENAQALPLTEETVYIPRGNGSAHEEPRAWLMLVDGGGSFLLLMNSRISIGRHTSSKPADLPIMSDLRERHGEIARMDEDYFFFSPEKVEVSGRLAQQHLLRDGDRIVLGKRAKMTFRLPSRTSLSAVLQLSDTTKAPHDVRTAILFDKHATLGNGPTAHILCRTGAGRVLIHQRADGLYARDVSSPSGGTDVAIRPGETVEILGMRFVLQPWQGDSGGRWI